MKELDADSRRAVGGAVAARRDEPDPTSQDRRSPPPAERTSADSRSARWAGWAVVVVSASYMLLWWNRYLSPNSGGEIFYLSEFAAGRIPHRDFYYFAPPGGFLTSLAVGLVAGAHQIAFHLYGLCFRVLALWVLFRWLKRWVDPKVAAFAVIVTGVVAAGDISDYPNFFQHQALGFSLFGAFAASTSIRASGAPRVAWAALAGLLLGMNLLYKQTTGVLVFGVVTGFLALGTWLFGDLRSAARSIGAELAGFALPVSAVIVWLSSNGALAPFIDQVFVAGPASKGGIVASLARPFLGTYYLGHLLVCAILAMMALAVVAATLLATKDPKAAPPTTLVMTLAVLLLLVAGVLGTRVAMSDRTPLLAGVYFGMLGGPPMALATVVLGRRHGWSRERVFDLLFLAAIAFVCAFSMSISFPAFEPMAYPGLAVVLSFFIGVRPCPRAGRAAQGGLVAIALLTLFVATWRKHVHPYEWGFWSEPPLATSRVEPRTEGLEGFLLSEHTARFFDDVTSQIRSFSRPEDRLLVYPHMPIFYALSHRRPAGFVFSYWFDICPDLDVIRDAKEVLANPPAVIVVLDLPPSVYLASEAMFRNGRPSGQRHMAAAIATLEPQYRCTYQAPSSGSGLPIRVLVRNDRLAEAEGAPREGRR